MLYRVIFDLHILKVYSVNINMVDEICLKEYSK